MGTRFEALVYGQREEALRAATEEAFEEIKSIEARISVYRPESLVSKVNQRAAREWVLLDAVTFRLIEQAKYYHSLSGGLFDPTIGPLLCCWGLRNGAGRVPSPSEIEEAKRTVGFGLVELNRGNQALRFLRTGMELDFGAIGKGFAP